MRASSLSFLIRRKPSRPAGAGLLLVLGLVLTGCGAEEPAFVDGDIGVFRAGLTVGQAGGCSTSIVAGLSKQLIDEEMNCILKGGLESFAGAGGVSLASGVNPFLEPPAVTALKAAIAEHGGTITINSALRTLAQQYLLYKWQGTCGIQIAAAPGNSNHETGIAFDTPDYSSWMGALQNHGWRWYGSADVVHFDYVGGGSQDLRPESVLAFQRLWNANNPNDKIAEDSSYGPATEARVASSPATGFPIGMSCSITPPPPPPPPPPPTGTPWAFTIVNQGGPASLHAGETAAFWVEAKNTGTQTWTTDKTRLGTENPRDRTRALASAGWLAPNRPAAVGANTKPGEVGRFTFNVTAPAASTNLAFAEQFGLVEEGVAWLSGKDWTLDLEVLPPGASGGAPEISTALDGNAHPDAPPADNSTTTAPAAGGCSATGHGQPTGGAAILLLGLGLFCLRARRVPMLAECKASSRAPKRNAS